VDASVAPARILLCEVQDEHPHGVDGARPAGTFRSGHRSVASAEQVAVPAQDGVRAYHQSESVQFLAW
jgi:hypothetical protein